MLLLLFPSLLSPKDTDVSSSNDTLAVVKNSKYPGGWLKPVCKGCRAKGIERHTARDGNDDDEDDCAWFNDLSMLVWSWSRRPRSFANGLLKLSSVHVAGFTDEAGGAPVRKINLGAEDILGMFGVGP